MNDNKKNRMKMIEMTTLENTPDFFKNGALPFSITAFSVTALSMLGLTVTLGILLCSKG
jgi:hypothetical protein